MADNQGSESVYFNKLLRKSNCCPKAYGECAYPDPPTYMYMLDSVVFVDYTRSVLRVIRKQRGLYALDS